MNQKLLIDNQDKRYALPESLSNLSNLFVLDTRGYELEENGWDNLILEAHNELKELLDGYNLPLRYTIIKEKWGWLSIDLDYVYYTYNTDLHIEIIKILSKSIYESQNQCYVYGTEGIMRQIHSRRIVLSDEGVEYYRNKNNLIDSDIITIEDDVIANMFCDDVNRVKKMIQSGN
jgi:hypothetical protein